MSCNLVQISISYSYLADKDAKCTLGHYTASTGGARSALAIVATLTLLLSKSRGQQLCKFE